MLVPFETINRKSPQEFARWGETLGSVLNIALPLVHVVEQPATQPWHLVSRQDFSAASGAPVAILRFRFVPDKARRRARGPRFQAGDLFAVLPPGISLPRYYSAASSSADGFLEIAVRLHPGGFCSTYLHGLAPGSEVRAFVRPNPEFHLVPGRQPAVLIGTGCGLGPLAGFIRANERRRPIRLYFGAHDRGAEHLYQDELATWLREGRLSDLVTSFLAEGDPAIADCLEEDAATLRALTRNGAQFMVVGGREMAGEVAAAIERVVATVGLSVAKLRSEGRYVENNF